MEDLKPNAANSSPLTPLAFLDRAATVYGDCISIIYNQTTFTWSDTHQRCLKLSSALTSIGIKRGDVVSVLSPNVPAMYELQFGVPMSGAVLNTINTRLDARTVAVLLKHSGAKVLFVDCLLRGLALEAVSMLGEDVLNPVMMVLIQDEYEGEEVNALTVEFLMGYEDFVKTGNLGFEWLMPESEWDPIVLNYTSGTTSAPKGVVHYHRAVYLVTLASLVEWSISTRPVYLWTLPMFHANGWCFPWAIAAVGGVNVCVRKFDASVVFNLIERHGVTHMCGAPVVLNMLSNWENARPLRKQVKILTAGAPPPAAVLLRTESLGFDVTHGYGLTETAGLVVICAWKPKWNLLPASEQARLKAIQGVRTHCVTKIDVINPVTRVSVPWDGVTVGEIVLRGGSLLLGYFKDPESTARAISGGWFFTGDVGVMHENGYMEIKDRSKDVIISGGENLSSVEIESVLFRHPSVNEVAVVARPDEFWGETPCAFVSLKGRKVSERELMEYCREKLPHYMVPKTVVFVEELPKTSTGKVQKFVLREMAKKMGSLKHSRI